MKAIIKLDVPEYQIDSSVTVYFKDTMRKNGTCEKDKIVYCKDCKFWYKDECSHLCKITGDLHPANWFCADGERRTE